jgi:hypothetical protein
MNGLHAQLPKLLRLADKIAAAACISHPAKPTEGLCEARRCKNYWCANMAAHFVGATAHSLGA